MRLEDGLAAPRADVRVVQRALINGQKTRGATFKAGVRVLDVVEARFPTLTPEERVRALRVVLYEQNGGEHVLSPFVWHRVRLKPGAFIVITDPPMGGAFRSILQIVVSVAAMAIAGPLGPLVGGALGIGATAGTALVGAGLAITGNLLLNALVPLRDSLGDEVASPLYTLEGFKNQARIGAPIPLPIGLRHRYAPPYVVPPYIDVEADKIFLTAVFCCGYAPMARWDERIGDRSLDRFSARTWQAEYRGFRKVDGSVDTSPFTIVRDTVVQRGQNITLKYREDGVDEEDEGPRSEPTVLQTAPDTKRVKIILSFPQGLHRRGDKGSLGSYNCDIQVMVRPVTPGNNAEWTLVENVSVNRRTISAFYCELGEYVVPDGFRGAYEYSLWRMTAEGSGGDEVSQCDVVAIQSIMPEYPINQPADCPFAMVALRLQATNQLKGTLDEYNLLVASLIDKWDHESESYDQFQETGNPADWYRRVLTMPQNAKRVPEAHMFEDEIREWNQHCRNKDFEFSRVYDYDVSADAVLRDICAVGRAVPRTTGGLRGVSVDRPKDPLEAFPLTPHNTWGFEGKREFKENDVHGWRIKFRDRTNDFKTAIREVIRPDLPDGVEATNFQEIEPPGITHPKAAYIHGMYLWLVVIHRPDTYTSTIDIQSRLLQHGDLGAISHRLIHAAQQSGKVIAVDGRDVVLSEPVTIIDGRTYAIKFQHIEETEDGDGVSKVVMWPITAAPGERSRVTLVGTGDLPAEGDLAWFGESSMEDILGALQNVEPSADFNARLTLVAQANLIFDILDDLVVPPWSSRVGSILPDDDSAPPRPIIKRVMSSASVYGRGETVQNDPRRIVLYVAPGVGLPKAKVFRIRHRKAGAADWTLGEWTSFAAGAVTIEGPYKKGDDFRAQIKGATKLGVESEWSDTKEHVVGSKDAIGPVATDLSVVYDPESRMLTYSWLSPIGVYKARLYVGPSSAATIADMTALHKGYLTASPYEVFRPKLSGDYKLAVVLEAEDGTLGVPAFMNFTIPASATPPIPEDLSASREANTMAVTVACRAGDTPENTKYLRFYRRPQGQAWDINTATFIGKRPAGAGDTREMLDKPGIGIWLYDAVAQNADGTLSSRALNTKTVNVPALADYNFAADTYDGPALSISGGENGTVQNNAGVWSAGRRTNKGRMFEQGATNYVRDSTYAGATAGTPGGIPIIPITVPSGLTRTVSKGATDGVSWVEIAYSGTTTSASAITFVLEQSTQIVAANGEVWAMSAWVMLTDDDPAITTLNWGLNGRTSAGTNLGSQVVSIYSTRMSWLRRELVRTLNNAGTERVTPFLQTNSIPSGTTISVAFRFGLTQAERDRVTSPIPTTGTSLLRPADVGSVTLPANTTNIIYTYDNDATEMLAAAPGAYVVPNNLARPQVKRMQVVQL